MSGAPVASAVPAVPAVRAVRYRGVEVDLAGTTFVVPPLTLGALEEFEQRMADFQAATQGEQMRTIIDLGHRALGRNYPELTRAQVAEMLDLSTMFDLFLAVLRVSGLLQNAGAGAGKAAQTAGSGTGLPSMPTSPPVSDGAFSTAVNGSPYPS